MKSLGIEEGDLVEVYNDTGATQAMAYPTPTARKGETFMMLAWPTGSPGNVVNRLVLPTQADLVCEDFSRCREGRQRQK